MIEWQQTYTTKLFQIKEDVLRKVIQQLLGREVFADSEVKDFQIVTHIEHPNREFISYKGNMIGEMVPFHREENNQIKMGFEFVPKIFID